MPGFLARPHIARDAEDFCNRRLARIKTKYMQNFFQLGIDCCVTVATEDDQTVYSCLNWGIQSGSKVPPALVPWSPRASASAFCPARKAVSAKFLSDIPS